MDSVFTTSEGSRLQVRFLTPTLARIQLFPQCREFEGTGLNRYHFLQEPEPLEIAPEKLGDGGWRWSSGALSVQCDARWMLLCQNGAGETLLEMTDALLGRKAAQVGFRAQEDEDWVGFGDQTRKHLYHRGHKAICWVSNVSSYCPVPFFMSTKGYGVVVNSTHCVIFDMAKTHADTLTKKDEPWFQHLKKFVDWGADFFKQDGAFQVCTHPDRVYGNGMLDSEMHNLYPLLYARQMWEGFAEYTHRRPVVFTPSGWVGFQSHCGTWTGDVGGRLETLGSMLNTSLVGHSWCTNDMEVAEPEGIHFGYLQPWSQINSWSYFRMPWLQGEELRGLHKFYACLRSRLIPYIYSAAREATLTGIPVMRPLTLEFQNDRKCRDILHEYLLGRDLLVTIYKREIYLPEGEWKDFWTGKTYAGNQTLQLDWPENRGGNLLVRQGAVIPFGPVMQYRKERPLDEVELYLFPTNTPSQGTLYEDDGVSFEFEKGAFTLTTITAQNKDGVVEVNADTQGTTQVKTWKLTIAAPEKPKKILFNHQEVPFQWDAERGIAQA